MGMNPEYQSQAQRLEELRRSMALRSAQNGPYEDTVVDPGLPRRLADNQHAVDERNKQARGGSIEVVKDPLIFPGLYAPSGFDMMSILIRVYKRPNPTIQIGNVDSAVALTLVDAEQPGMPLIYCSEPFEALTGYRCNEILGTNCRFLQHPPDGTRCQIEEINEANAIARKDLREKIARREEAAVRLWNYRKDGSVFANLLTIIPIVWDEEGGGKKQYIVGFQADERRAFL